MIDLNYISGFFARPLRENPAFAKHIVKEYVQLMVLDFLSSSPYIRKLAFLKARTGVGTASQLKAALRELLARTDMGLKKRDFEHLVFSEISSDKVLRFADYIEQRLT